MSELFPILLLRGAGSRQQKFFLFALCEFSIALGLQLSLSEICSCPKQRVSGFFKISQQQARAVEYSDRIDNLLRSSPNRPAVATMRSLSASFSLCVVDAFLLLSTPVSRASTSTRNRSSSCSASFSRVCISAPSSKRAPSPCPIDVVKLCRRVTSCFICPWVSDSSFKRPWRAAVEAIMR